MTHIVRLGEGNTRSLPGVTARRLVDPIAAGSLDGLIVSEVIFLDDHTNPGHSHPEQEVFYFLDAVRVQLQDPQENLEFSAGDCLYVGAGRFHRVVSSDAKPARAVVIKTGRN